MKRNVLVLVLFAGLVFSMYGQSGSGFVARETDGKITITDYNGTAKDVVIPDVVNGMPIVAIAANAFNRKGLTSVIIGNNVTFIGDQAFFRNPLTSVIIGNNVTYIGELAFGSNHLTSITIPNSVREIEDSAFLGDSLTSVTIGTNVMLEGRIRGAIDWGFEKAYRDNERKAGTYRRADADSRTWSSTGVPRSDSNFLSF